MQPMLKPFNYWSDGFQVLIVSVRIHYIAFALKAVHHVRHDGVGVYVVKPTRAEVQ